MQPDHSHNLQNYGVGLTGKYYFEGSYFTSCVLVWSNREDEKDGMGW